MSYFTNNKVWFLSVLLVSFVTLGVLFSPAAQANDERGGATVLEWNSALPSVVADRQIFNEDFVIESGQMVEENVAVFRGRVDIAEGGTLRGDLSVFGGNVVVAGTVDGNLAVIGGAVELRDSARITGDVSVVGGAVNRARGAFIGGNFFGGPRTQVDRFQFNPALPQVEALTNQVRPAQQRSFFVAFFLRLLQAALWTILITGLVLLLVWLFPRQINEFKQTAVREPALSFATGLIVALAVLLLGALFALTLCLLPFSLLLWGLLAIVAVIGWAVIASWLGEVIERAIARQSQRSMHSLIPVALGALLLTGVTFFSWSLIPCLGLIVAVLIGATGVGAVLVHLARRSNFSGGVGGFSFGGPSTPPAEPTAPSENSWTPVEPGEEDLRTTPASDVGPVPSAAVDEVYTEPAPAVDETEMDATGLAPSEAEAEPAPAESPEADRGFVTGEEMGLSDAERDALRRGAGITGEPDDFLRLRGIGPTFNRRLQEAGVTTYAQMAAMSPEELAQILGWPPERVVRDQLREQAAELASRK
jgi:predicted flap endonuclease-1-like 5' DNA nuclease/cytoskeletal protein CcmA (bactofilin family)